MLVPSSTHQAKAGLSDCHVPQPAPLWLNLAANVIRRMPVGRYSLISRLRRGPQKPFLVKTPKKLGNYKFEFSFRDQIGRQAFFAGCYEPQESACLRDILRPGMIFVDVGANWGFFTLMAARLVGSSGRVVAIEADPRVSARLKQNVAHNDFRQVQVFDMAVADRNGLLILAGHDEAAGNPGVSRLVENSSTEPLTFSVRSCRLDLLLDEIGLAHVDLLKIDVEGAEDLVLAGMEEGLKYHRYGGIILEIHRDQLAERGRTVRGVIEVLSGAGYHGYILDYFRAERKAHYQPWLHFSEFILPLNQPVQSNPSHLHTIWFSPRQLKLLEVRS